MGFYILQKWKVIVLLFDEYLTFTLMQYYCSWYFNFVTLTYKFPKQKITYVKKVHLKGTHFFRKCSKLLRMLQTARRKRSKSNT